MFQEGTYTGGFVFSISSPIDISSLGFYDEGGDGLAVSHDVGLWDTTGTLLASATVDAGATDPLIGKFRYKSIPTLTLAAGDYVLGSLITADDPERVYTPGVSTGLTTASEVTLDPLASRFTYAPTLTFPTSTTGLYTLYAGPNFLIGAAAPPGAVPEPGALALLIGSGLSGGLLLSRRRARKR